MTYPQQPENVQPRTRSYPSDSIPYTGPNPPTTITKRNRKPWIIAAITVLALVGAGIGVWLGTGSSGGKADASAVTSAGPATFTLHGVFTLADSIGVLNVDDTHCTGMDGYAEIMPGASVTITDAGGTTIAVGELGDGTMVSSGLTRQCQFAIEVPNVPTGKSFYGVQVTHRGLVKFSESQAQSGVVLTLG